VFFQNFAAIISCIEVKQKINVLFLHIYSCIHLSIKMNNKKRKKSEKRREKKNERCSSKVVWGGVYGEDCMISLLLLYLFSCFCLLLPSSFQNEILNFPIGSFTIKRDIYIFIVLQSTVWV
jgi:hypothetical protein